MKIVLTGGHVSPLLSVIDALPKDTNILVVGRRHTFEGDSNQSFEYKVASERNIPFRAITAGRLQRTFTKYTIPSLIKLPIGFFQSLTILSSFKPDAIISFGGYVSLPVVLSAALLRIPIVIHEQTLSAGLANKIAAVFAKKVCISWESSEKHFPAQKTILTGNPMRKFSSESSTLTVDEKESDLPLIYITGGSAGSHTINEFVEGILRKLLESFRIIHQTGDSWDFKDFEKLQHQRASFDEKLQRRYALTKFVEPETVGMIIQKANLVISRSGMNTITELLHFGKPALLIPLNKEQTENALFFQKIGLGEFLSQETLTSDALFNKIAEVVKNRARYEAVAKEAKALVKETAAREIVAQVTEIVR